MEEMINAHKILAGKPEEMRLLRKPRHRRRRKDNVKKDLGK
jgi:hypothetical protein